MNKALKKLDSWSDELIKNSILGKLTSQVIKLIPLKPNINHLNFLSMISTCVLFLSLSLPQFTNERFGIGLVILFCFLLNLPLIRKTQIKFNCIDFLIIIFILISLVSTFNSYFFKESLIGFSKYLVFFLSYIFLKVTVINCSEKSFLNLWSFLFFCAVITSLIGIYQYIIGVEPLATWEDPNSENIHTRVYSTLGNPNLLAGYLLTILPIGIVIPFKREDSLLNKILYLTGSLLILICLIFTGSRGGYLGLISGFIFGLIIFLNYIFRRGAINRASTAFIILTSVIIFYLLLMFLFPAFAERISTIFTLREHSSNSFRVNVWISCLKMLKDNWLIGIGPGNSTFRLAYGLYMTSGFDALAAYNIFLEIAIELGIFGLLTFLLIFLTSLLKLHYIFWGDRVKGNIMALGIFISLIALITHGMVDTVFFRPQIFIAFWFLLASIDKLELKG